MKRREVSERDTAEARERARLRREGLLANLQSREAARREPAVPAAGELGNDLGPADGTGHEPDADAGDGTGDQPSETG